MGGNVHLGINQKGELGWVYFGYGHCWVSLTIIPVTDKTTLHLFYTGYT